MKFPQKQLSLSLIFLVSIAVPGRLAFGNPQPKTFLGTAELASYGFVSIDGDIAETGTAVFSGSTIETIQKATAVVSAAREFRIELLPSTSARITFLKNSVSCEIVHGAINLSASKGTSVQLQTRFGTLTSDGMEDVRVSVSAGENDGWYSRFEGSVKSAASPSWKEVQPNAFFRADGSDQIPGKRPSQISNSGASQMSTPAANFLVGIGTLFVSFCGLALSRDASFFRVGGLTSLCPHVL